jgi:GR25 family glycosyltransferase involved in LPS biosynthesis
VTAPGYCGLYINLDRSPERRRKFEKQLADLNIASLYTRFPAVDGSRLDLSGTKLRPGEVGVFHSHCQALEQARSTGKCVHILEDDALLSEHVVPVIEDAIAANLFDRYDLLFTDMMVHCHIGFLKNLKSQFDKIEMPPARPLRLHQLHVVDLSQVFHAGFQSYIVGAKSVDKVLALYRTEIGNGPKIPVDIFIQQQVLAGKLRAACIFPFITSFRLEDVEQSTIADRSERTEQPAIMVMAVLRYLFFLGCDLDEATRVLDAATRENRKPTDLRHALIAQAVEFVLSDDFTGN